MSKYVVFKAGNKVIIARDGYGPTSTERADEIGSFSLKIDEDTNAVGNGVPLNQNGEHILIAKAKELLDKEDISHTGLVFEDRASNAPVHDNLTGTTDQDLPESEDATHPEVSSQKGGVQSAAGTDPKATEANGKSDKT